jgi:hypothetical protein
MKEKLSSWLNTFLVADFFLVVLGFAWFVVAVAGEATGINLGLDLWHKLWMPLFNPAIGILMAGAIMSGVISWISRKLVKN